MWSSGGSKLLVQPVENFIVEVHSYKISVTCIIIEECYEIYLTSKLPKLWEIWSSLLKSKTLPEDYAIDSSLCDTLKNNRNDTITINIVNLQLNKS